MSRPRAGGTTSRHEQFRTALRLATLSEAVRVFAAAEIEYLPAWPYTDRIWELRDNLSAYDACYVAMAEDIGCALVTTDARLGRAPGLRASVIVA